MRRSATIAATCLALLAVSPVAGCSPGPNTSPSCNTCDGNVAVSCDYDCHWSQYTNPQRTDCGSLKCTVDTQTKDCIDMGSSWLMQVSVAECK